MKKQTMLVGKRILSCYASGNGCIDFTYLQDIIKDGRRDTISVGEPTLEEILNDDIGKEWLARGWRVEQIGGRPRAFAPVHRLADDRLSLEGHTYRYIILQDYGTWKSYNFLFNLSIDGVDREFELKNESIKASLRFFLEHEEQITPRAVDYAI